MKRIFLLGCLMLAGVAQATVCTSNSKEETKLILTQLEATESGEKLFQVKIFDDKLKEVYVAIEAYASAGKQYKLFSSKGEEALLVVSKYTIPGHCRARVCPGTATQVHNAKLYIDSLEDEYFNCL